MKMKEMLKIVKDFLSSDIKGIVIDVDNEESLAGVKSFITTAKESTQAKDFEDFSTILTDCTICRNSSGSREKLTSWPPSLRVRVICFSMIVAPRATDARATSVLNV